MTWASDIRLAYIDLCLAEHGEVQRQDIMDAFSVSQAQASADLAEFDRTHRGAMVYDKSIKRYVPAKSPYRSRYRLDARKAIAAVLAIGQPSEWRL